MKAVSVAGVLLLGTLLGLLYTYPLLLHFGGAIPYTFAASPEHEVEALVPGDQLQFYYALSLGADMVAGRVPWFQDPYQFSAPEAPKRRTFFFLPFTLLFAAFAAPFGGAAAYNLLVLFSFPAMALSVFLLAARLGFDWRGAMVSAVAATLLPYRVASLAGGHPTGLSLFLLPLAFYFIEKAWQESSRATALAAGGSLLVLAVNEPHIVYFFAFLLPLWLVSMAWRVEPARRAQNLLPSLLILGVSALGPALAFALLTARQNEAVWAPASLLLLFLVFWAILVVAWRFTAEIRAREGGRGDAAWKSEAASYLPPLLLSLYSIQPALDVPKLGRALILSAVLGLLVLKRPVVRALIRLSREPEYRAAASRLTSLWPFALGFAAAVVILLQYKTAYIDVSPQAAHRALREVMLFAPSPEDFFRRSNIILSLSLYPGGVVCLLALFGLASPTGRALILTAAVFAALALGPRAPDWLPLYSIAFRVVPFFGMIRQPVKLFAVAAVALALAAGVGVTALCRRRSPASAGAIFALCLAGIAFDFSAVLPLGVSKLPTDNRAYAVIAERARGTNLLELPLWPGDSAFSSIYLYWATRAKVPMVNGYSPTVPRDYIERVDRPLDSMNVGELGQEQNQLLDELRVRYVTLHRDSYPPQVSLYPYRFALAAMRQNPNLRFVTEDDGVYLFERVAPYRTWHPDVAWPMGVFYEAEGLKLGSGKRIEDPRASGGAIVRGAPAAGVSGLPAIYGPYRPLPRGRYEARFRARGKGTVEAVSDLGRLVLASRPVESADWQEIPVGFELGSRRTLEFRAWPAPAGEQALDVDWVLIRKVDGIERGAPPGRFEVEDMVTLHGIDRESPEASGQAYAGLVGSASGRLVRDGPYQLFDPGRLHLVVRSRRGAIRVRVESADGLRRFAEVEVRDRASWHDTAADFELPKREILCTRIFSTGAEADVDFVELTRTGSSPEAAPLPSSGSTEP